MSVHWSPSKHYQEPPALQFAEGTNLMGEYKGSGFTETPYLARWAAGLPVWLLVRITYLRGWILSALRLWVRGTRRALSPGPVGVCDRVNAGFRECDVPETRFPR